MKLERCCDILQKIKFLSYPEEMSHQRNTSIKAVYASLSCTPKEKVIQKEMQQLTSITHHKSTYRSDVDEIGLFDSS